MEILVRSTNWPGNEATLDASWRIRDADSAVHPSGEWEPDLVALLLREIKSFMLK